MHEITQCLCVQIENVAFLGEYHNEVNDDIRESKNARGMREKRERENSKNKPLKRMLDSRAILSLYKVLLPLNDLLD